MKNWWTMPVLAGLTVVVAACGGEGEAAPAVEAVAAAPAPQVTEATAPAAAPADGAVIEVRMYMAGGARFEPAVVEAKRGDVIRFVNVDNVHNISFPAAENPSGAALPASSPYLTQPDQTWDLRVDLPAGDYTFQCDPHVMMGMKGELKVSE